MLKQRVITALAILLLLFNLLFILPAAYMCVFVSLVVMMALYEYTNMIDLRDNGRRLGYIALAFSFYVLMYYVPAMIRDGVYVLACFLWLLIFILLFLGKLNLTIKIVAGMILIPISGYGLWSLYQYSPYWVLVCCMIVWVADTGAYFTGKTWGKNKLAPHISPGKTKEGLYGAIVLGQVYGILIHVLYIKSAYLVFWLFLVFVLTVISVCGDLYESQLKRDAKMKDSGRLLPGHGGVLDRIDSLIAVIPFFVCYVHFIL